MEELTYQNPYVCVDSGCVDYTVRKQGGKTVMWVKYPDDYQARQKQLADFVDAAKPSITSGSDRDKAIAIDQFLAAHIAPATGSIRQSRLPCSRIILSATITPSPALVSCSAFSCRCLSHRAAGRRSYTGRLHCDGR